MSEHGLTDANLAFTDAGIMRVVSSYTREAGLRNLEREIGAICRKVAVRVASGKTGKVMINPRRVERYLGVEKHRAEELLQQDRVGVATGSRGPRPAAICCSSKSWRCPARGCCCSPDSSAK
jgi:ATP-dependent Lon protease